MEESHSKGTITEKRKDKKKRKDKRKDKMICYSEKEG